MKNSTVFWSFFVGIAVLTSLCEGHEITSIQESIARQLITRLINLEQPLHLSYERGYLYAPGKERSESSGAEASRNRSPVGSVTERVKVLSTTKEYGEEPSVPSLPAETKQRYEATGKDIVLLRQPAVLTHHNTSNHVAKADYDFDYELVEEKNFNHASSASGFHDEDESHGELQKPSQISGKPFSTAADIVKELFHEVGPRGNNDDDDGELYEDLSGAFTNAPCDEDESEQKLRLTPAEDTECKSQEDSRVRESSFSTSDDLERYDDYDKKNDSKKVYDGKLPNANSILLDKIIKTTEHKQGSLTNITRGVPSTTTETYKPLLSNLTDQTEAIFGNASVETEKEKGEGNLPTLVKARGCLLLDILMYNNQTHLPLVEGGVNHSDANIYNGIPSHMSLPSIKLSQEKLASILKQIECEKSNTSIFDGIQLKLSYPISAEIQYNCADSDYIEGTASKVDEEFADAHTQFTENEDFSKLNYTELEELKSSTTEDGIEFTIPEVTKYKPVDNINDLIPPKSVAKLIRNSFTEYKSNDSNSIKKALPDESIAANGNKFTTAEPTKYIPVEKVDNYTGSNSAEDSVSEEIITARHMENLGNGPKVNSVKLRDQDQSAVVDIEIKKYLANKDNHIEKGSDYAQPNSSEDDTVSEENLTASVEHSREFTTPPTEDEEDYSTLNSEELEERKGTSLTRDGIELTTSAAAKHTQVEMRESITVPPKESTIQESTILSTEDGGIGPTLSSIDFEAGQNISTSNSHEFTTSKAVEYTETEKRDFSEDTVSHENVTPLEEYAHEFTTARTEDAGNDTTLHSVELEIEKLISTTDGIELTTSEAVKYTSTQDEKKHDYTALAQPSSADDNLGEKVINAPRSPELTTSQYKDEENSPHQQKVTNVDTGIRGLPRAVADLIRNRIYG